MRISQHPILDQKTGREVSFTFDGQPLVGREGEMVSSALFANGIRTFSRHKVDNAPQGIFCANGQCAQCTVLIERCVSVGLATATVRFLTLAKKSFMWPTRCPVRVR